jgi:hypothetical protein
VGTKWNGEVVATIDMLLALFVIMLALAVLVQPHKPKAADQSPGQMKIELRWVGDNDVDLWALAPGAQAAVGYSHKTDHGMALLRDDLGPSADADSLDYEIASANIIRPGLYVVNAHLFRWRGGPLPVHVKLKVSIMPAGSNDWTVVANLSADLAWYGTQGQELTLIRFRLDDKGQLVPGSINDLPTPLRAA